MERFRTFELKDYTYRFDKYIVLITFIILFSLTMYVLYLDGFSGELRYYSECPSDSFNTNGCYNSFYESKICSDGTINPYSTICTTKLMMPGESIGTKPHFIITYFTQIGFSIILLMLIINNYFYNKDFFKYIKDTIGGTDGSI